jgi:hypothetical protein
MYVTAHRVRSADGPEAVHAFLHEHGPIEWPDDVVDWPETNPGSLVGRRTTLRVGGNAVLSYLDVLAPDATSTGRIEGALTELRRDLPERANPTTVRSGPVTLRFGTNLALEARRVEEFDELARVVAELRSSRSSIVSLGGQLK